MSEETVEIQVAPGPKKRGRKRKSELSLRQIEEILEEPIIREETVSRRGRPRKKVNYYELANPDGGEFYTQPVPVDDESSKKIKLDKSHTEDEPQNGTGNFLSNDSTIVTNGTDKDEVYTNGKKYNKPEDAAEDVTIETEATTSTPKDNKKYNYTGETVKMMNTLFNYFTGPEQKDEGGKGKSNKKKPKNYNLKEEDLDDGSGNVTCAICNKSMDKTLWSHHKLRYHNNLAWREGDPPLDLNDQSFVMHTLNNLYKKKKPLYCDKCGEVKKSVVGFLSHRSQCLKSEEQLESVKIACQLCGRKMLPVSMSTHLKSFHGSNDKKYKEGNDNSSEKNKFLPSKRSAAKKAMKIIETVTKDDSTEKYFTKNLDLANQEFAKALMQQELNATQFFECKFRCNCIATSIEDALGHFAECTEKPTEGFVCKQCLYISGTLDEMVSHVESTHDVILTQDDEEGSYAKETRLPLFLYSNIRRTEPVLFPHAFDWTFKFCEENFSKPVFEDFPPNSWSILPPDSARRFLPSMDKSCDVGYLHINSFINPLKTEHKYKKYNLFESEVQDNNKVTLFCGGPVSCLAWLPTPYSQTNQKQILAVSVLNSPDAKYLTCDNFQVESAVQFWDFGALSNKECSVKEPKLAFNLAHNHGPVWHMEWCPSGCYGNGRMGLLALTGSDSVVYIYSIPFFENEGLYYKPKSVMKLLLQRPGSPLLGGLKYYPSKISWSKAAGHQYVCVGYTNGFIGLFNLKSSSVILKFMDSGATCLLPTKCFQAHSHNITALILHHFNGGSRWLVTGSSDRNLSLWDLENHSYPVCSMKTNLITDGFWLSHWLCFGASCDEGSTASYVTSFLKQVRDFCYDTSVTVAIANSTVSAVSGSDWLNGVLHASSVGEIIALFPHQMLLFSEHQKVLKMKRMLFGYTCLLDKHKSPNERVEHEANRRRMLQNAAAKEKNGIKLSRVKVDCEADNLVAAEPLFYHEAQEKYALLFCDNKMKSSEDFPKTTIKQLSALSKSYGTSAPNQYPLQTINKIVFNPNRQCSLYYATGYQAGFVRISWMEFLKNDYQIK